jgi:hypothetical protein
MTTVKRITDLSPYESVLPYASELFGIYQPLLGWKSRRIQQRIERGRENDRRAALHKLTRQFSGLVQIGMRDDDLLDIRIDRGALTAGRLRAYDSIVLDRISAGLPPHDQLDPSVWPRVITEDRLDAILKNDVPQAYQRSFAEVRKVGRVAIGASLGEIARLAPGAESRRDPADTSAFQRQLQYESSVAGTLLFLTQSKAHKALEETFYATRDTTDQAEAMLRTVTDDGDALAMLDLEHMNPRDLEHLQGVVLSPIGLVHLFRQYFFELDTFLGTPESHVWMSPGSSVELFEIHTRRTIVEKTLETALDILNTSETTITNQEEISEAVKDDNSQDIKVGASVKGSYGSIEATSSFDYSNSQKQARENTHKRMRQQTDKLSTQIRRNFKSTFKTVTEVSDVSSTRHLLANTTDHLLNYELRRKMRQVGVQVQDIGTFLCWQTYVDDPGRDLGLGSLIHIAKPAELDGIPHPEEIPPLPVFQETRIVTIPFVSVDNTGADKEGEVYVNGIEADQDEWGGSEERIQFEFEQEFVSPRTNYALSDVEFDPQGKPVSVSRAGNIRYEGDRSKFTLHLDSVDFQGKSTIELQLILHWSPSKAANDAIKQKNEDAVSSFKQAERQAYEKAMVEAVKERVTLASKIQSRRGEDLREEERIVVYRKLIQDMLLQGVPMPDDRTRHVVAEVLNSIFDVDKMLYFVAPEWWRPRLHHSRQQLQPKNEGNSGPLGLVSDAVVHRGLTMRRPFHGFGEIVGTLGTGNGSSSGAGPLESSTVGWGGVSDRDRDNYYITDESEPAHFGSSLGWLLQLDGDSMRNAFLNAPWVKAVIPIRPGREEAAINWLKGVEGMNGIDDSVIYHASDPDERDLDGQPTEGQKMIDVLLNLARKIQRKYGDGNATGTFPKTDEVSDPSVLDDENTVTSTPIDRVYEHGFFPLQGGFRSNVGKDYEIFDQWIEILPTDQIVPVEVQYDPKTGRQV